MRKEDLQKWLSEPSSIDADATRSLERALVDFPYSSVLQQLYFKGLQNQESYLATAQLKKASIFTSNRELLKDWVDGADGGDRLFIPEEARSSHKELKKTEAPQEPVAKVEVEKSIAPETTPIEKPVVAQAPTASVDVSEANSTPSRPQAPTSPSSHVPTPPRPQTPPAKPTVLGDDLSHLPERVRAIIEKSRQLNSELHPASETEPSTSVTEEVEEPVVEEVNIDEETTAVETPDEVDVPEAAISDDESVTEEYSSAGEFNLSDIDFSAMPTATPQPVVEEVVEEEAPEEEVLSAEVEEFEERDFGIVLDELTGESDEVEELLDSSVELDFVAWLKQKQHHEEEAIEPAPKVEFRMMPEAPVISKEVEVQQELEEEPEITEPQNRTEDRARKMDLIDKFIMDQPKIRPSKQLDRNAPPSKPKIDVSAMGSEVGDDLVTETLAHVYYQQGYLDKALSAYEILSLKYPEKSSFFADQISEIRREMRKSR